MLDVLVVGAGPAGISAAIICAKQGLLVKVVDEFIKPGGRLLGQLHEEPDGVWWNGMSVAEQLVLEARNVGVDIECGVSVYNIHHDNETWKVYTTEETIHVRAILLATGATETAIPIPGWTLPGVMSIGAAQVMTNVHRVSPGKKGVVIGINLLSTAIARELQLAGVTIESMVLPSINPMTKDHGKPINVMESLLRVAHLAPTMMLRFGSRFMKGRTMKKIGLHFYPRNGFRIWGIPVKLKQAALEIIGSDQVEGVRVTKVDSEGNPVEGTEEVIEADFVCIAGGLYPLVELAAVSGCPFQFVEELGGHVPVHSEEMRTPLQGLYVAGNITGIESAKVAMTQGEVAGYSIASDLLGSSSIGNNLEKAKQKVKTRRATAVIQFHPHINQGRERINSAFNDLEIELYAKEG
jgi:sarcosine oxidase, subunit alpha